jgi:putative CocE/NonD family hydrolase
MSDNFSPVIREFMVPSADGTKLFTRVMLPCEPEGRVFPAVFHRSPYEPGISAGEFTAENIKGPMYDFLAAGYAVVNQHCRGTGLSEGVFRNMMNEREDGLSTLDWIKKQPWYGGGIFLYGASYKSFVHSAYIPSHPSEVRGAVLAVMPSNLFYVSYEKNTYKHDLYTLWFTRLYMKNQLNAEEKFNLTKEELKNRPLIELPERVYGHKVPEMTDTFLHNRPDDEFWRTGTGFGDAYETPHVIDFPLLLIGGFYDIHYKGTLDFWERLNPAARQKSAFLIGPWGHSHNTPPEHEALFPRSRRGHPEVEWFNHIRIGTPLTCVREGKIRYYSAGEGWRYADALGADSSGKLTLYPSDDGRLCCSPSDGSRSYEYDPRNPAFFPGGSNVFQSGNAGLQMQPGPDFRPDVLSFVSEPFENEVILDGGIHARLEVSSDCTDTAFFVRADIIRDGAAWYMRDTIVSISDTVRNYKPGKKVEIDIALDPVAWKIRPGDRIRFDISSSDFPTYNAHSNTSVYWCYAKRTRIAHNTVYMKNTAFELTVR